MQLQENPLSFEETSKMLQMERKGIVSDLPSVITSNVGCKVYVLNAMYCTMSYYIV